MAKRLNWDKADEYVPELHGNQVISSDLYDRGFGDAGVDFLDCNRVVPNIVTNPPYNSAEGFVRSGLEKAERKFALLLRLVSRGWKPPANDLQQVSAIARVGLQ
jgi:hypothetical protein